MNKKDELLHLISERRARVVALTEIRGKNQKDICIQDYNIPGYDCFMNEVPRLGVALYVDNKLNAKPCTILNKCTFQESVWCYFCNDKNEKILLGCIYRSPNSTETNKQELIKLMKMNIIQKFEYVCIMGDFNFPTINWDLSLFSSKDSDFVEALNDAFLVQLVTNPTRRREGQRPTLDDLILVNNEELVSSIEYHSPIGKSDHDTLIFEMLIKKSTTKNQTFKSKFLLAQGDYVALRESLANVDWSPIQCNEASVEDCWLYIKDHINTAMCKHIPKIQINEQPSSSNKRPIWMNKGILKKIKHKYNTYKQYLQTLDELDYQLYIKARNKCTKAVKMGKIMYERNIALSARNNPKCFWKYVRSRTTVTNGIAALDKSNGELAVNDKDKANVLNDFFSSVFVKEDVSTIPSIEKCSRSKGIMLSEIVITAEAVQNKLLRLDVNKACGPDNIPPRVLKEANRELSIPLAVLFNKSLKDGIVPKEWKEAEVVAIFKKGQKSDPGNYRPVSLTCIICKILESFIRDAIVSYMTEIELFSKCQHGFRPGRSCMTQLLEVMEDFTKMWDNKDSFDIVYLDFRKAFDTVPHKRLLTKLELYGITGNVSQWIENFLLGRLQVVKVGDSCSEQAEVLSGIPQGSVLGPVLFTIFINDLPDLVKSTCKIFADDTKLYNLTKNSLILQEDLDRLMKWSCDWNLKFNVDKCKILHMGRNNPEVCYTMATGSGNFLLNKCVEERDLGVVFDQKLEFDKHINETISKSNKMLGIIKRSFTYLDKNTFLVLYKCFVRSYLEYGNIVWHPLFKRQSVVIEKVQRRATKLCKGLSKLSYYDRMQELGLPSLKFRRLRGDLIQAYKIINNILTVDVNYFFQFSASNRTRNSVKKIFINRSRTNLRKNCFNNRVARFWNLLPPQVKNANNVNHFKNLLEQVKFLQDMKFDFDS